MQRLVPDIQLTVTERLVESFDRVGDIRVLSLHELRPIGTITLITCREIASVEKSGHWVSELLPVFDYLSVAFQAIPNWWHGLRVQVL